MARWSTPRLLVVPVFALVVLFVAVRWSMSATVGAAYVLLSAVTFAVYAHDKAAARRGRWRVPEARLHALSLFCGWPGALLAQQLLRHKSSKPTFVAAYWATVAGNIAAFVFFHSPLVDRLLP